MKSRLHSQSLAAVITFTTLVILSLEGMTAPTPTMGAPPKLSPLKTGDFVRVTAPWLAVPIENASMTCEVGSHLMLIQENDDFFITMCSNEYKGVFLAAFPTRLNEGRPAWTTPEQKLIFAYRTSSCRGNMYFRQGEALPVDAETCNEYQLKMVQFGHVFPLHLSKSNSGIEFVKASPPPSPQTTATKTAQKATATSAQKIGTPSVRKTTLALAIRPPPTKRYIITPVGSSTNLFPLSTEKQLQSSVTSKKAEKPKEETLIHRLISCRDKSGPAPQAPQKTETVNAESIQKPTPPLSTNAVTNKILASTPLATNSSPTTDQKTPQTYPSSLKTHFTKIQTPLMVSTSLALLLIGLYGKNRLKAHRPKVAIETATEASNAGPSGSEIPPPTPAASHDFSGSIASMSLGSVAQLLNSDKKTGTLLVKDQNHAEIGALVFIEGQVIDAQSRNNRGIDAFYKILRNREGFFSFLSEEPKNVEKTITQDIISLLMEAHRLMDEELAPDEESTDFSTAARESKSSHQATPKSAIKLKLHGNR